MLTSVYYYSFYRPYIVSSKDSGVFSKRSRIADKRESFVDAQNQSLILNKSRKNEIVQYARSVSEGVTGLKSSARQIVDDMELFNRNANRDGFDATLQELGDDLEAFAEKFNESASFMKNQTHSQQLRAFSDEVNDQLYYHRDRLALLGLSLSDEGRMAYDRTVLENAHQGKVNVAIGENLQIFNDTYQQVSDFLTAPLSEHMNFKGLNYHYNYKMGGMVSDGFGIIESGLLMDRVV